MKSITKDIVSGLSRFGPSRRKSRRSKLRDVLIVVARDHFLVQDYERISVGQICKAAQCSIGAFYRCFPSKFDLARSVIDDAFEKARDQALRDLEPSKFREASSSRCLAAIIEQIASVVLRAEGGVLRMASYLSHIEPNALRSYRAYQSAVIDSATAMLRPHFKRLSGADNTVRSSLQAAFSVFADAVIHKHPADIQTKHHASMLDIVAQVARSHFKIKV